MSIKLGITGGIGSGKSVVSRLLEAMGVPVYISDVESKRLTQENESIRRELTALVGEDVYKDGMLNKPLLAAYIFGNPLHKEKVDKIIHPHVKDDFRKWSERHKDSTVIAIESAILVEAGFAGEVDHVVMVYAPLELRVERAVRRDAVSRELIEKRIRSQMDDEQKKQFADFVICNDNHTSLIPQLMQLIAGLNGQTLS